ncbi:MAG: thiamine phosphate synthase [Oscillospiraceae bacterium]
MFTFPNKVICVTCRSLCPRPLEQQVGRIAAAGVNRLILREKDLSSEEYLRLAERVNEQCRIYGVDFIIHSFPEAARALGVNKLHMPLPLLTEELCREFAVAGTSVHSAEEAVRAEKLGASYVTAGHIFATDCKKGVPPRGLEFLREVCRSVDIPVYAIGGINEGNIDLVLNAGADGACIMSGLMTI